MDVVVLMKQIISSDVEPEISKDGKELIFRRGTYIINEADEYALETALRLTEDGRRGRITAISLGPMRVREALYIAMAKGVNRAVHILVEDEGFMSTQDSSLVAKILSIAVSRFHYDVILTGSESFDNAASSVGVFVAEFLGIPHISAVSGIEVLDETIKVKRELGEGYAAELLVKPPVLLTIQSGIYSLRYCPLFKILAARRYRIETLHIEDLGLSFKELKPRVKVLQFLPPPKGREAKYIRGSFDEIARSLLEELKKAGVV
jgi:electron transfer flavoprotein beta subunit